MGYVPQVSERGRFFRFSQGAIDPERRTKREGNREALSGGRPLA